VVKYTFYKKDKGSRKVVVDGEEDALAMDSDEEKDDQPKKFNINLPDFCIIDNFSKTFQCFIVASSKYGFATDKYMFSQLNMTYIKRVILSLNAWEIYKNIPETRHVEFKEPEDMADFEDEMNDHYEEQEQELEFTIQKRQRGGDHGTYEINYFF